MQTEESILKCNTIEDQNVVFDSVEDQNVDSEDSKKIVHINIDDIQSESEWFEIINDMVDGPRKDFLLSILSEMGKIKTIDNVLSDTE